MSNVEKTTETKDAWWRSIADLLMCIFDNRPRPPYDDRWKAEDEWFSHTFVPYKDVDYSGLLQYAVRQYDTIRASNTSIDEKAAWLFGIIVLGIGAAASSIQTRGMEDLWLLAPFVPAFIAVHLALKTRVPDKSVIPTSIRALVEIDQQGYHADAWMVATYHCTVEGMMRLNRWKGRHLESAARWLVLSLVAFVLVVLLSAGPDQSKNYRSVETMAAQRSRVVEELELAPVPGLAPAQTWEQPE